MKERKGRRVVSKEGIEYTIVDDMKPSKLSPSMKKKFESINEKIKRSGFPKFPPFED